MNEGLIVGLIVALFVFFLSGITAGVSTAFKLSERITKIEATISLFSEKAAKILHSPHTPKLDRLLEKYIDRTYELSYQEWTELLEMCNDIENDKTQPRESRALAAWMTTVCHHKLQHAPPEFHNHDEETSL